MNKLRQSFRRKKDVYVPEASRPHQWQTDEEGVRTGKCSFPVKVSVLPAFQMRYSCHELLFGVFLASMRQQHASLHTDLFCSQLLLPRMWLFFSFFLKPDDSCNKCLGKSPSEIAYIKV